VPEYPGVCYYLTCNADGQADESGMGLVWVTQAAARSLASRAMPLSYTLSLKLSDPAAATAFAAAHGPVTADGSGPSSGTAVLTSRQIEYADNDLVSVAQQVLTPGSWLAIALAIASVAVLAGGRMAEQTRRVGRLKRRAALIAISARLPAPLLIGLRIIARRPRRAALAAASTVTGIVAVMAAHRGYDVASGRFDWFAGLSDPVSGRVSQVMAVLTVVLVTLAAVNAVITGWSTAMEARQSLALMRALGGTPQQVSAGLAAAQVLPALPGAIIGIPLGIALFAVANGTGGLTVPPLAWLVGVVVGTVAVVAALTAVPASLGARQPAAPVLRSGEP
jgi:hypothetical protein